MKKYIYIIMIGILTIVAGLSGYQIFQENFGSVHGLISYSNDKEKLEERISKNKDHISECLVIEGKYVSKSDTLVLDDHSVSQLIKAKALNKVTQKSDKFTFATLKQLEKTPILWSRKEISTVSDDKNINYSYPYGGYVVLGESSITSKILVLSEENFEKFDAPKEYISVIKDNRAADDVATNYYVPKQLPIQIFHTS